MRSARKIGKLMDLESIGSLLREEGLESERLQEMGEWSDPHWGC